MRSGTLSCCSRNSKNFSRKITLTVLELQQFSDTEKADSRVENYCLKSTIYKGRRKVCLNFKTDTDKLNFVYKLQFIPQR